MDNNVKPIWVARIEWSIERVLSSLYGASDLQGNTCVLEELLTFVNALDVMPLHNIPTKDGLKRIHSAIYATSSITSGVYDFIYNLNGMFSLYDISTDMLEEMYKRIICTSEITKSAAGIQSKEYIELIEPFTTEGDKFLHMICLIKLYSRFIKINIAQLRAKKD